MIEAIEDLKAALEPHRKEERAAWQTAYLRHQFPFLGVERPVHQKVCRKIYADWDVSRFEEGITLLWNLPEREFQYTAIDWALFVHKQWKEEHLALFEKMLRQRPWWDTVDPIAAHLVGRILEKFPQLLDRMDDWIKDENFWIRRTALIYQLRYKQKTDENRLFSYCLRCAEEKEFFIRKAIGWALREYAKTNQAAVEAFIASHRHCLSPLSVREASRRWISKQQR